MHMDLAEEALDDAFADDDVDEESNEIVDRVMAEVGLERQTAVCDCWTMGRWSYVMTAATSNSRAACCNTYCRKSFSRDERCTTGTNAESAQKLISLCEELYSIS